MERPISRTSLRCRYITPVDERVDVVGVCASVLCASIRRDDTIDLQFIMESESIAG